MFDSQILEVVIGLIFIFLLFSLLATSFQELIANFRNSRGKMLQEAIYDMTGNTKPRHYRKSQTLIASILLVVSIVGIIFTQFGISPPFFLETFINQYKMVILWHSWVMLLMSLFYLYVWGNYYQKNLSLHNRLPENELAKQILQNPRFERLGRQNSIDNLTSYIPGDLFAKIFVEALGEKNIVLGNFESIPLKENPEASYEIEAKTQHILQQFHKDSMGNVALFGNQVEQWFDDTMSQVQGWYKREAQRWLFFIGLMMGVLFNINPFQVSKHLNESDEARKVLSAAAQSVSIDPKEQEEGSIQIDLSQQLVALEQSFRTQQKAIQTFEKDLEKQLDQTLGDEGQAPDSLQKQKIISDALILVKNHLLQDTTTNRLYTEGEEISQYINRVGQQSSLLGIGWNEQNLTYWNEANYAQIFLHFLGLLIFGLAISLGAPFWFDLLNRFINIRHAGARPKSSKEAKSQIEG